MTSPPDIYVAPAAGAQAEVEFTLTGSQAPPRGLLQRLQLSRVTRRRQCPRYTVTSTGVSGRS